MSLTKIRLFLSWQGGFYFWLAIAVNRVFCFPAITGERFSEEHEPSLFCWLEVVFSGILPGIKKGRFLKNLEFVELVSYLIVRILTIHPGEFVL